ncbi:MAG: extracellular solute-binding protein [Treponema sp.]|nr:extracellular solute-binding protein [Treponema sp.]
MIRRVLFTALLGLCFLLALPSCERRATSFFEGDEDEDGKIPYEAKYADIVLGETSVGLEASITLLTHRTDMVSPEYKGRAWKDYIHDFNVLYPGIKVSVEALTDYNVAASELLEGGNWGDIMMIPISDRKQYSKYFIPFGMEEELSRSLRFADQYAYDGRVYGIASAGNVQGILYNRKVFREAGITRLPRTPDEFLEALRLVKKNTRAIPLYTNYASGWPLNQWDYYITSSATGDSGYLNHTLPNTKDPFSDPGNGSGAYNVYRILYQAVAEGLTESDFATTDWEGCKGMMNRGDIATMALGSWVFTQVQNAGPNAEDIGYMPFPMLVDGVQIAQALPDNNFGINIKSSSRKKLAAMLFVKWMVEKSGFQYNEGELPVLLSEERIADVYTAFNGIEIMEDTAPFEGEENLLIDMNVASGLFIGQGGTEKFRHLVEHAATGDMSFDEIMAGWNQAWSRAQANLAAAKD